MKNCLALLICLAVVTSCGDENPVIQTFKAEGHAMSPTLQDGETFGVRDYDGGVPARGDVVVFAAPTSPSRMFIKRIIGLPGEMIEIDQPRRAVLINGTVLDEPYAHGVMVCMANACSWTIPSVEGDVSISKEDYEPRAGPSPPSEDDVCARTGCYFVMGDNRQNSSDSRQGWLVPAENIRGFVEVD